jgi:hypothetical protein
MMPLGQTHIIQDFSNPNNILINQLLHASVVTGQAEQKAQGSNPYRTVINPPCFIAFFSKAAGHIILVIPVTLS